MTEWYNKLTEYFPAREMKSKDHMQALFMEKGLIYKREEGPAHIVVYLEKEDFIFIDYILVSGKYRGNGMGSTLINRLKKKGKPIILEVEPITPADPDTKKRVIFYEKNSFRKATSITYKRLHIVTNELNEMDIYYWSPTPKTTEWVFEKMKGIYREVHAYRAADFYGKPAQEVSDVLSYDDNRYRAAK
ncbi:GNAT family N-acetyltransferase [Peribacillus glennii]|uniref:GNAT family N-acetyltransferase n=1 Tax=Peribacillus glennii TaxID=2303991 RepID=A0A372LCK9_9BACI|nr:GNAT family N-acetyltransferase [Peribacillus glennii]RFU63729.1 GNAT family N-acetyltransferase [Peribacillus glennii]